MKVSCAGYFLKSCLVHDPFEVPRSVQDCGMKRRVFDYTCYDNGRVYICDMAIVLGIIDYIYMYIARLSFGIAAGLYKRIRPCFYLRLLQDWISFAFPS